MHILAVLEKVAWLWVTYNEINISFYIANISLVWSLISQAEVMENALFLCITVSREIFEALKFCGMASKSISFVGWLLTGSIPRPLLKSLHIIVDNQTISCN